MENMMKNSQTIDIILRNTQEDDYREVENMTREAFWDVYKAGCDEHLMVRHLHEAGAYIRDLDFVAVHDGRIVGNILCSKGIVKSENESNEWEVVCIGPIGVLPEYQGKGIGSRLMQEAIKSATQIGAKGIVLYGNPAYYHRFGFENAIKFGIRTSWGANFEDFMALELREGSLQGIQGNCYEDVAFEIDKEKLEEFEKGFPVKESHFKQ
jgi:predicted N-acetyltransferase YhbS